MAAVEADRGRVKGVLRDRNHDGIIWTRDQGLECQVYALWGTFCQEDIINWRLFDLVLSADVIWHRSSHHRNAQRMSVTARTHNLVQVLLCPFWGILVNCTVSNQTWVQDTWQNLPVECYRFLFELLGIPNVAESYPFKRIFLIYLHFYLSYRFESNFSFGLPMLELALGLHTELKWLSGLLNSRNILTYSYQDYSTFLYLDFIIIPNINILVIY